MEKSFDFKWRKFLLKCEKTKSIELNPHDIYTILYGSLITSKFKTSVGILKIVLLILQKPYYNFTTMYVMYVIHTYCVL